MTQQRYNLTDDDAWTEVPSGSSRVALFPLGDDEDGPTVVILDYRPNAVVPVHSHDSDYISIVVDGDLTVTRHPEAPGSVRVVQRGTAYGPLEIGPRGARVIDVFARRAGSLPRFVRAEDRESREGESANLFRDQLIERGLDRTDG